MKVIPMRQMSAAIAALEFTLLLTPIALRAQEDEKAVSTEVAVQPKAVIELGAPFCDNMVLQRERPVTVWGWKIGRAHV